MLSYRHGYHAGNHADVLKHGCLALVLQKLVQKEKPLSYIDTHAGGGAYKLDEAMALKNREYLSGVSKLKNFTAPEFMHNYLTVVADFMQRDYYPGSAALAAALLRPTDKLHCFELHSNEFANLQQTLGDDSRATLYASDGLNGANAICPPTPRRGVVLIDPPYEQSSEYTAVAKLIAKLHRKWPVGVIALWYPLLAKLRNRAPALISAIAKSTPKSLFCAELWVQPQGHDVGMYGSGMLFINLPWQVDTQITTLLPLLAAQLGDDSGGYRSEWLIQPD